MSSEEAVRAADEIIRSAWAEEMLRCRAIMQDAVQYARGCQRVAQSALDSAITDGDPTAIAAACTALADATSAVNRSSAAAETVLPVIERELLACAVPID